VKPAPVHELASASGARDPYGTRIPADREYVGGFVGAREFNGFGERRYVAFFRVIEPEEFAGREVPLFVNIPAERGPKRIARSSNFARAYMVATGRREPTRKEARQLKPADFLRDCAFRLRVRDVEKSSDGIKLTEEQRYSKIEALLERVTGSPPCISTHSSG